MKQMCERREKVCERRVFSDERRENLEAKGLPIIERLATLTGNFYLIRL
jgi:hypothetical protein